MMIREDSLLVCCARAHVDARNAGRLTALVAAGLDWGRALNLAERHGLSSLLYQHLSQSHGDAVPKSAMQALRDRFQFTARRNLLHAGELIELLAVFDAHGVPAIPYKGPVLAAGAYGNLALRTFADLDILVPRPYVRQASALLRQRGYVCDEAPVTAAQEHVTFRSAHELVHHHRVKNICVEIHWALLPRYMAVPIDVDRLLKRSVETTFMGRTIRSLAPEDLLLILCIHGANHCWQRLEWVCDVAQAVRSHRDLDWGRLVTEAEALGCRRILLLGAFLAANVLNAGVPEEILTRAADDRAALSLAEHVRARLFTCDPRGLASTVLFHIRIRERIRDRVRCSVRLTTILTLRDIQVIELPRRLQLLYYVIRPVRLLAKYVLRTDLRRPAPRST